MLEHGILNIKLEDNILIIEGTGPWNREALLLSFDTAGVEQKRRISQKWAVITIFNGDPIYTPDAADLLIESIEYDKLHGRVATAVILKDSNFPGLGKRHLDKIYKKAGEPCQFFENLCDAKVWVKQQIAL
ncbi:hypothetical protein [Psychromonas hadalis]|uniref:hypothetical protein n=1 Tax=Psychromonas hadalis TaxID=211669 RepID=UPI0003B47FB9|nr:hypothetical protein [Psychromonas hadalis]